MIVRIELDSSSDDTEVNSDVGHESGADSEPVARPTKKSDSGNKPVANRAKLDKSVKEGKLAIYYCK
jgi:hypothetical protein